MIILNTEFHTPTNTYFWKITTIDEMDVMDNMKQEISGPVEAEAQIFTNWL